MNGTGFRKLKYLRNKKRFNICRDRCVELEAELLKFPEIERNFKISISINTVL
jgi:hypothetical protein